MTHDPITLTESEFEEHTDGYDGFCLKCREWNHGDCEPDMRNGPCQHCGEKMVFGAEELLMHGVILIAETEEQ